MYSKIKTTDILVQNYSTKTRMGVAYDCTSIFFMRFSVDFHKLEGENLEYSSRIINKIIYIND